MASADSSSAAPAAANTAAALAPESSSRIGSAQPVGAVGGTATTGLELVLVTSVDEQAVGSHGSASEERRQQPVVPVETEASCGMDCGYRGPVGAMKNIGTKKCPHYLCRPCNSARKAIEFQFRRHDPALRQWFAEFKRKSPDAWKRKVRARSLSVGGIGTEASTVTRGAKIAQFIQTAKQFLTVQETCEVVWLRHNQFVQHMVNAEGLTVDAAEKKWAEALENPRVQKSGSGQDVEVAVALPRKTVALRGKTTSTTLSLADTLDSDAALTSATKRMKLTHLCRASTDSVFEEVGAAVFKSGAASLAVRPVRWCFPQWIPWMHLLWPLQRHPATFRGHLTSSWRTSPS